MVTDLACHEIASVVNQQQIKVVRKMHSMKDRTLYNIQRQTQSNTQNVKLVGVPLAKISQTQH